MKRQLVFLSASLMGSVALASEPDQNPWVFVGSDFGWQRVGTNDSSLDPDRSGMKLGLKAHLSLYTDNWVYDLGPSWFYSKISGELQGGGTLEVTNRAVALEFSPRHRFGSWQLGPVLTWSFGTDVNLTPSVGEKNSLLEVGLQVLREAAAFESYRVRYGIRGLTDLNSTSRTSIVVQGLVQIGMPFGGGSKSTQPQAAVVPAAVAPTRIPTQFFNFKTGSAELTAESMSQAERLGDLLVKLSADFAKIAIHGHTDAAGSDELNLSLSKARSATIEKIFVGRGVAAAKLSSEGFGESQPVATNDTAAGRAQNRRVELLFSGIASGSTIAEQIEQLR
jgi:outer membrane protein OmpA-like peptidoglycan-associated protein